MVGPIVIIVNRPSTRSRWLFLITSMNILIERPRFQKSNSDILLLLCSSAPQFFFSSLHNINASSFMTRVRDLEGCPLGLIWPGYPRNIFILINEQWTMSKGSDRPNQLGPNKWHRWQAAWHGMISVAKCGPMRPFIFFLSLFSYLPWNWKYWKVGEAVDIGQEVEKRSQHHTGGTMMTWIYDWCIISVSEWLSVCLIKPCPIKKFLAISRPHICIPPGNPVIK